MSQTLNILKHLQTGKSITPVDALDLYGCLRLAARINELRDIAPIKTRMIHKDGKSYASYSLVS